MGQGVLQFWRFPSFLTCLAEPQAKDALAALVVPGGRPAIAARHAAAQILAASPCNYPEALAVGKRAFVADLMEAASTRLLHCPPFAAPGEAPPVLLASKRFLECSLCALEHACSDSAPARRSRSTS